MVQGRSSGASALSFPSWHAREVARQISATKNCPAGSLFSETKPSQWQRRQTTNGSPIAITQMMRKLALAGLCLGLLTGCGLQDEMAGDDELSTVEDAELAACGLKAFVPTRITPTDPEATIKGRISCTDKL